MNKPPDTPGRDSGVSVSKLMMGAITAVVVVAGAMANHILQTIEDQGTTATNHYVEIETRLATIEAMVKNRDIEVAEIKNSQTDVENRMTRIEWAGRPPRPKN